MLLLLLLFNPRAIWRAYPWQCLGRRPGLVAEVWVISFSQGGAGRRSQPWQPFTQPAQSGQPPRRTPTHTHTNRPSEHRQPGILDWVTLDIRNWEPGSLQIWHAEGSVARCLCQCLHKQTMPAEREMRSANSLHALSLSLLINKGTLQCHLIRLKTLS